MAPMVLELDILLRPPPRVTSWHCFPENTLSCNHSLTALQKIFVCITSPHTSSLKTKCQISSPACYSTPCDQASPHRHTLHSQLSSTLHLSGERHSFWAPCEESSDLLPAHISHHVSPTGSDLARTQAALGVMNHHFIFLSHMWVKLFDINHTPAAPVWNKTAICLPVAGCSLCLYPERPF